MRSFMGILKRDMLVYLKDKQAVFFSILSPIIVLALYLLFLRSTFVDGLESAMQGVKDIIGKEDINSFANLILLAGVLGSGLMTVSYACVSTIVSDRQNRISYDILSTPLSRGKIILAYALSAFINTFMITGAILTIGLVIISLMGKTYLTVGSIFLLYGILALGAISSVSFMMLVVLFFKTTSAAAAFTGILCAASGFIIGAYIPISQFSSVIQTICNLFPASHITALFRTELLNGVLANMDTTLNGIDNHELVKAVGEEFSLNLNMFNQSVSTTISYVYSALFVLVSSGITAFIYSKTYKA